MIPQRPWQRVHVDHAYFDRCFLLVAVDTYSKWPEVNIVSLKSAQQTIYKHFVRYLHVMVYVPAKLVSGSLFQSVEFQQFVTANGILHDRRVPLYHPASNGLAKIWLRLSNTP